MRPHRAFLQAGTSRTFFVPLKFGTSGNITVEARAYPIYNDTWMALGTGSTYVLGYGNVTLAAVDETNAPVTAEFYVDRGSVGSGTSVNTTLLEGTYPVAIKKDSVWINSSVNVTPSRASPTRRISRATGVSRISRRRRARRARSRSCPRRSRTPRTMPARTGGTQR
ncbi:hypothetical protein [Methanoculleus sp. 10]|uniref:hypothetical protein n=1 Tax=Methanoculleus sp. 10 TaxID=430615 RepID=UPI0025F73FC1|nr:hypothetical protein [Methanoculleus sp. 10]